MIEGEKELQDLLDNNSSLKIMLDETKSSWENEKDKEFMNGRKSKELHLKILDILEALANELLKIKDVKKLKMIRKNIYLMTYDFYSDTGERILSDPVEGIFDSFNSDDSIEEIIKSIKLSREKINELFEGF